MKVSSRVKKGGAFALLVVGLVAGFEGLRTTAYRDPVGIPTVCFGETRGVHMGDSYTVAQCRAMLGQGLAEFEAGMTKCLTDPEAIPDPSYAAFLSFAWNVGIGNFCNSTLHRRLNAGDLRGACNELLKWTRAGGRVLPGLVKRRQQERDLCLQGVK